MLVKRIGSLSRNECPFCPRYVVRTRGGDVFLVLTALSASSVSLDRASGEQFLASITKLEEVLEVHYGDGKPRHSDTSLVDEFDFRKRMDTFP